MNHKIYLFLSSFSLYFFVHHLEKKKATSPTDMLQSKLSRAEGDFVKKDRSDECKNENPLVQVSWVGYSPALPT
jgi:hypothetical protein